jgi:Uma2 family endonuclease
VRTPAITGQVECFWLLGRGGSAKQGRQEGDQVSAKHKSRNRFLYMEIITCLPHTVTPIKVEQLSLTLHDGKIEAFMATARNLYIPVGEYLRSDYHPDCDFVDGVIEERNLGELDHSELQKTLLFWFEARRREWGVNAVPEIRIQVSPTRFRVADVGLILASSPREQIIQTPPLAVIEILSPEDRVNRYRARLEDYRKMGVRNIWVIDPKERIGFDCSTGNWIQTKDFAANGTPVNLHLDALFADVDGNRTI